MVEPIDGPSTNRYGFHSTNLPVENAGVTSTFVHEKVSERVANLLEKARKAHSLKRDDPDYTLVVDLLNKCSTQVTNALTVGGLEQSSNKNTAEAESESYSPKF